MDLEKKPNDEADKRENPVKGEDKDKLKEDGAVLSEEELDSVAGGYTMHSPPIFKRHFL